jgi:hypothetical protein
MQAFSSVRIFLAWLAMGLASVHAEDGKHTLRYRFAPGESVYFTSRNDTTRQFVQTGRTVLTRDSVDTLKHYRVVSVDSDGGALLELTIDRAKMSVDQGDRESRFSYDSAHDRNPPAAFQVVHGAVGRPWLRATVNSLGATTKLETPSGTKVPESADFVSRVLPLLPEHPVAIGDAWKEPFTVEVDASDIEGIKKPIKMQRVYRLDAVENGVATVALRTEVLTGQRTAKDDLAIIQRKFTGSILIDVANGRLLGRNLEIEGNVVGYDGPMSAMDVKLKQTDAYAPAGAATPFDSIRTVGLMTTERSER